MSRRLEAERVVRHRDELLAIVAHDLRSPLSSIIGASSLLVQLPLCDADARKIVRYVAMVQDSADRMRRMVDDLLDLSSFEGGRLRIELGRHDARALVEDSVAMHAPIAAGKALRLDAATPGAPVPVDVDRGRIAQVLANLVGNAIKFTPEGGAVSVSLSRDGDVARIVVSDTGVGIAPPDLPWVFDRYWRGRSLGGLGAGLGLAIAKALVEAHRGEIVARSTLGAGTIVEVTLPIVE